MTQDRDQADSPKPRRLVRGAALSVVVVALTAPFAGAAGLEGVQVKQAPQLAPPVLPVGEPALTVEEPALSIEEPTLPIEEPALPVEEPALPVEEPTLPIEEPALPVEEPALPVEEPTLPIEEPALPVEEPTLPDVPRLDPPPIAEVTTLPASVEVAPDVGTVVDDVIDAVVGDTDEVEDTVGEVEDTVDEAVSEVEETLDEVIGGADDTIDGGSGGNGSGSGGGNNGIVGGIVGGIDGAVDGVTGGNGPVEEVVDEVTDVDGAGGPVEEIVDEVRNQVGNNGGGGTVEHVVGVVDGLTGGSAAPGPTDGSGVGPNGPAGTRLPGDTSERVEGFRTGVPRSGSNADLPDSVDGFAAGLTGSEHASAAASPTTPAPSFVERIARAASEVATQIAFPMLLAAAVAAFVIVQNRIDRKDPKLALAALDADEDLLGFE